jgi:hypothetical protein
LPFLTILLNIDISSALSLEDTICKALVLSENVTFSSNSLIFLFVMTESSPVVFSLSSLVVSLVASLVVSIVFSTLFSLLVPLSSSLVVSAFPS